MSNVGRAQFDRKVYEGARASVLRYLSTHWGKLGDEHEDIAQHALIVTLEAEDVRDVAQFAVGVAARVAPARERASVRRRTMTDTPLVERMSEAAPITEREALEAFEAEARRRSRRIDDPDELRAEVERVARAEFRRFAGMEWESCRPIAALAVRDPETSLEPEARKRFAALRRALRGVLELVAEQNAERAAATSLILAQLRATDGRVTDAFELPQLSDSGPAMAFLRRLVEEEIAHACVLPEIMSETPWPGRDQTSPLGRLAEHCRVMGSPWGASLSDDGRARLTSDGERAAASSREIAVVAILLGVAATPVTGRSAAEHVRRVEADVNAAIAQEEQRWARTAADRHGPLPRPPAVELPHVARRHAWEAALWTLPDAPADRPDTDEEAAVRLALVREAVADGRIAPAFAFADDEQRVVSIALRRLQIEQLREFLARTPSLIASSE